MSSTRNHHQNNFDILRLLAALQVAYFHLCAHLRVPVAGALAGFGELLSFFPGVPIFFVISGFLVSMSYERVGTLKAYAWNRFLRIYPALWVCFLVSLVLIASLGFVTAEWLATPGFWAWVFAQLSFAQFYNPSELRSFGVGALNGNLWTIPVELSFYVALPAVYGVSTRLGRKGPTNVLLALLALASFALWCWMLSRVDDGSASMKLLNVSLLPHLHLFLLGLALQRNFDRVRHLVEGKVLLWTAAYLLLMYGQLAAFGPERPMALDAPQILAHLASRLVLGVWVISFAFSLNRLSSLLLRGNDVSYGLYIYHAPIINLFVWFGWVGSFRYFFGALGLSLFLAGLSWVLVESRALRMKLGRSPMRPALARI